MDSAVKNKSITQPKTMAELLPGLCGILSKDAVHTLTAKKQNRPTTIQSRTAEKALKPMTIAQMRGDILALRVQSPRKFALPTASAKKRHWNSSVKVENKSKSHTADGQMKYNSVRKVLNFQSKPKPPNTTRATMATSETITFPKPEIKAKKSLHIPSKNSVRISGICHIPETPVISNKVNKNRMTIQQQINKENNSYFANLNKKLAAPKLHNLKKLVTKPETPIANMSFKSNSDASFLEKEKEINEIEEKTKALAEEQTLENIAEVTPPVSTPFKEYRNVQEFFNHTAESDNSALYNDTIMCFEKMSVNNEIKREESVIVSLCDMLNKAAVTNSDKISTELEDLLEVEKQTEKNIKMIENGIKTLKHIKESQLKSLQFVRKLINEKRIQKVSESEKDKTLVQNNNELLKSEPCIKETNSETSPMLSRPSVIKVKSPSYKIPKKSLCMRKKVFHKSMPNVTDGMQTPIKSTDKAMNMYMEMKEKMNFLNTPLVKHCNIEPPDTPAVTSHNLQVQLDKLFNGS
ncbi:uncharacterized protein LOC126770188 [Nymphalis io]|uniref:uncharacterized protein LOC126770188 n=1 Tax=Inachis io TaxID=171585 RepID=UPI0021686C83|nr:uncharacterized protein LOC126770188 [Nymphalis io]